MAVALFALGALALVLLLVTSVRERAITKLAEREGLAKRSGAVRMTIRLTDYRGHNWISGMRAIKPGELVLTEKTLSLVIPSALPIGGVDLANLTVEVVEGRLKISTDRPWQAQGSVEVSFPCEDADDWLRRLTARGAVTR